MNAIHRFRVRKTMIIATIAANLIGVMVAFYFFRHAGIADLGLVHNPPAPVNHVFIPIGLVLPTTAAQSCERPIGQYLTPRHSSHTISADPGIQ